MRLETTFGGAGVMSGDLTPECAAVVTAVLDALSAPRGAEDDRTHGQRYHDALEDAMRRLVAAGLLPERAGQPVKVWAHVSLADLIELDAESALQEEWTARVRGQWAAHRAAASAGGSDGSAWLDGDDAEAFACDASVTPVVPATVNPGVLEDLVRLCCPGTAPAPPPRHHHTGPATDPGARPDRGRPGQPPPGPAAGAEPRVAGAAHHRRGHRAAVRSRRARVVLAAAAARRPARRAEPAAGHRLQQRHPGRDPQRGQAPRPALPVGRRLRPARLGVRGAPRQAQGPGGKTSLDNCICLCFYHHQVVIHRRGWTLVRNPDGTTTAWNPDRTKVLRSHGPPASAG